MDAPYTALMFKSEAEQAAKFYVSIFPKSKVTSVQRMGPGPDAPAISVVFTLAGTRYVAINGGHWEFTEATSQVVTCKDQKEVDRYWEALLADGGQESMCGWLKDRFGMSWQVIPENIGSLISTQAGVQAMFKMRKLDVATLEAAGGGAKARAAARKPGVKQRGPAKGRKG